jgi:hypothetical protein
MRQSNDAHDNYLRHVAFMIASELPENIRDARHVLALLHEIVDKFYAPNEALVDLHLVRQTPGPSKG